MSVCVCVCWRVFIYSFEVLLSNWEGGGERENSYTFRKVLVGSSNEFSSLLWISLRVLWEINFENFTQIRVRIERGVRIQRARKDFETIQKKKFTYMSYTFPYCNMICTDSCLCNNKFHTLKECRATQLRIRVAGGAIVTILCDCDSGNISVYSECLLMWNAWKFFAKITKSPYRTKMILTKSRSVSLLLLLPLFVGVLFCSFKF